MHVCAATNTSLGLGKPRRKTLHAMLSSSTDMLSEVPVADCQLVGQPDDDIVLVVQKHAAVAGAYMSGR